MKKSDKKGFILAETVAVSTVVMVALVIVYVQFISINNSYYNSFKYNSVDNLYALDNIKNYLQTETLNDLNTKVNAENYVDITSCSYEFFTEYPYCEKLFETLKVEKVIYAKDDPERIKSLSQTSDFSEIMKNFIKTINGKKTNKHRLIVEFKNGTCATLSFY